jgi:hypothetical protein
LANVHGEETDPVIRPKRNSATTDANIRRIRTLDDSHAHQKSQVKQTVKLWMAGVSIILCFVHQILPLHA